LDSQHKDSSTPSIRSLVEDEEEGRPLVMIGVSCFLQCFDAVGLVTRRAVESLCHLFVKVLLEIRWRSKAEGRLTTQVHLENDH